MNYEKAIKIITHHGYQVTKQREDILHFFEQSDGYRTAKHLKDFLITQYPNISFDTIYRNLHLFHELSILERTNLHGEKHFRLLCSDEHHHHFICKQCGKTKKIRFCPMIAVEEKLQDYIIEDHKFEVYGRCPLCQSA